VLGAGAAALVGAPARAQNPVQGPSPTVCRSEAAGGGEVRAVTDGRSFTLDDGREIRIAGIEVPLPPAANESGPRAQAGLAARAALAALVEGAAVEFGRTGAGSDRYGRLLAQVTIVRDGRQQSVAHAMLAQGFARVSAEVGERPCAQELLGRERAAREAKLGLWAEPYYAVVGAETLPELVAERGRFTVVEGEVWSVRESGGTIYVNFGRRWSQGLTVTIAKRNERSFIAAGLPPRTLERRRVRVRGFIEERNGPRIEATRPEQIEIAERR
jgi:endonuclease YncB( thermonuclease family)